METSLVAQGLRLQLTMKGKVKVKVAQSCLTICDPMDCVDHDKLWKILKEMGLPYHLTCLLRNCMQVRKQQLELDMEQQTGSK